MKQIIPSKEKYLEYAYRFAVVIVWLSILFGTVYFGYNYIAENATAWEAAHPEYCSYEYDYRCGQKNPWGLAFFLLMIVWPVVFCFFSVKYNEGAEKLWRKFVRISLGEK